MASCCKTRIVGDNALVDGFLNFYYFQINRLVRFSKIFNFLLLLKRYQSSIWFNPVQTFNHDTILAILCLIPIVTVCEHYSRRSIAILHFEFLDETREFHKCFISARSPKELCPFHKGVLETWISSPGWCRPFVHFIRSLVYTYILNNYFGLV